MSCRTAWRGRQDEPAFALDSLVATAGKQDKEEMKILGIFGGYYNPAACLFVDGKMIAFIEEEKLTRKKTERQIYPLRSVKYVLKEGGLTMKDVDRIAFPWGKYANLLSLPWIGAKEAVKGVFGRRPAPVSVSIGQVARERLSARAAGTLPSTYDLRSTGRLSPVRDQGDLGTCWAFANLAAVESRLLPGEKRDFSEDNLVLRSGFGPLLCGQHVGSSGGQVLLFLVQYALQPAYFLL